MRVAILGGSFNPPHVAHILAVTWVLATRPVDQVWLMPVGQHAFGKELLSFAHRQAMLKLALEPLGGRASVTDVENRLGGENRTVDTLQHLQREHPDHRFSLIIGADILHERHAWKSWDVLERDFGFHLLGRDGYELPEGYGVSVVLPSISSTGLRQALSRSDLARCEGWLDRRVLAYIARHRLYGVNAQAADAWLTEEGLA
jgi:nicotinate-nucleotide adenylyltransferase